MATLNQIANNGANLSIPLYVKRSTTIVSAHGNEQSATLSEAWEKWQNDGRAFWQQMDALVETLDGLEST